MTVRELGEALEVRFGPLPLARTRIPYEQIRSVRSERTGLIDGWGIHYIPGRGLVWNVHGRDCVRLELKNGRPFRIGTDDPEGLAAWIRQKID